MIDTHDLMYLPTTGQLGLDLASPFSTVRISSSYQDIQHTQDCQLPTTQESRFISQCEMFTAHTSDTVLDHASPLRKWMEQWDQVGILDSVLTASLGTRQTVERSLKACNKDSASSDRLTWPCLGLRVYYEEQREILNSIALGKTKAPMQSGNPVSTANCMSDGIDAPLLDWIRVWADCNILESLVAVITGIGVSSVGDFFSHCENSDANNFFECKVSVIVASMRAHGSSSYVLSGSVRSDKRISAFAYHSKNRSRIPSIDTQSWLTGGALDITYENLGTHPFSLIERTTGRSIASLAGKHIMGLTLHAGLSPASDQSIPCLDVIATDHLGGDLPAAKRMPGVFPYTWLVQLDSSSLGSGTCSTAYLYRKSDPYEQIINRWLTSVASENGLSMHTDALKFRTAKCSATRNVQHYLLHPASDFTVRSTKSNEKNFISAFRMPMGSVFSSYLNLLALERDAEYAMSKIGRLSELLKSVGKCVCTPATDLSYLLQWIVYDSLICGIHQLPYRYQIINSGGGLALSVIPIWSTQPQSVFAENTKCDFGYQILPDGDEDKHHYLSDGEIEYLSSIAMVPHMEMIRLRDQCLDSLRAGAPLILSKLEQEATALNDADSIFFRNAKYMMEQILVSISHG